MERQSRLRGLCPDGGIGRRDGLKIRYPKGCVGSSPTPGTKTSSKAGEVLNAVIDRRLRSLSRQLGQLRDELLIADAQLAALVDDADDMQIRAAVEDGPGTADELTEARRHVARMTAHRDSLRGRIVAIESEQDRLLDRRLGDGRA